MVRCFLAFFFVRLMFERHHMLCASVAGCPDSASQALMMDVVNYLNSSSSMAIPGQWVSRLILR